MKVTAAEISRMLNGTVRGNPDVEISDFSPIESATEGNLSFLSNLKYTHYLYTTKASAVLVGNDFKPESPNHPTLIHVEDVYTSLSVLLDKFNASAHASKKGIEQPSFVNPTASYGDGVFIGAFSYVDEGAKIGNNTKIYPQVYIGKGVSIGDNTILYPGVKVYADCKIGNNCIIHSGAVIGSDGFGFAPQNDGTYRKMPQTGNVIIEDNVEIGANTTIDRATMSSTILKNGVKLDNLIQIAHNVEVGENTVIAAQTGISGSTKIEGNCIIAGQVGIVGHITIAQGSLIGAKTGVGKSILEPNKKWHGIPAAPYKETLRSQVIFKNLPALQEKISQLEQLFNNLKASKGKQ